MLMGRKFILLITLIGGIIFINNAPAEGSSYYYKLTGPAAATEVSVENVGDIVYFEMDSTTPDSAYGNIRLHFDPEMLECVSIEETPPSSGVWGFWTAWTLATGDAAFGGGGTYYNYDSTGLGSDWAQEWVSTYSEYPEEERGPVGTCDNISGIIRLYRWGRAGGLDGSVPLRLGFRIKQAGTAEFTAYANDFFSYSWHLNDLPDVNISSVNITLAGNVEAVPLDIYPKTCPNTLRVSQRGAIRAAILGTADLDINMIAPSTIRLEGVTPLQILQIDAATPFEPYTGKADPSDCTDEVGDGLPDYFMRFDNQELIQAIETSLGRSLNDNETVVLKVSGNLKEEFGGNPIAGEDIVVIDNK